MTDKNARFHPELSRIADWSAGLLDGEEARAIRAHLDGCPACRIELRRLGRFQGIDSDGELEREAGWYDARIKLERAFEERILPAVVSARRTSRTRWFAFAWFAPVAAAAAVLLVFMQLERNSPGRSPASGPLRGGAGFEYGIMLESPVGEIAQTPEQFAWHAKGGKDYFAVEIFTSQLSSVCRIDRIEDSYWSVPDSLRTLFEPGTIYLWHVRGYRGLEREVVSPNGWFRIGPGK